MQSSRLLLSPVRRLGATVAVLALFLSPLRATDPSLSIPIKCSPATVILDAIRSGDCLTVHADIKFRDVDTTRPVTLNGVEAYATFADNHGDLVAKFTRTDLADLLAPPTTSLTLVGSTVGGVAFAGTDSVRVRE
jgi:hypothetical protein